ncbi:CPCC family cysteine-rich protein [Tissierella carlieri]|uniref:CPCC family cysteine-rich protein n=1 Tax=Tissierella carlieri TaxID=689904 RepID=A0ABT1S6U9_9FIRM|nr:CPCC family cysteine-rich protein [Tissierella carlieri]MCQ4922198.1 CPCC family cysteine-rich protein [Tissierella carlieri]
MNKYTCPCCGYKTLEEKPPGTYDICPICFWEDDRIQFENPDYEGGANHVSLRQGQQNYLSFGACEKEMTKYVRKANKNDIRNHDWKPL